MHRELREEGNLFTQFFGAGILRMNEMIYQMNAAGHTVRYRLRSGDTLRFFRGSMFPAEGQGFDIAVDDERYALGQSYLPDRSPAYIETKLLIALTAQHLLRYDACIFHAAAFRWRGYAWLFTGPSGVGKSTQYRLWKTLFGPEVEMICGDMPILTTEQDGMIRVHPSAWNGKEHWSGSVTAPLGGIIFLEQAEETTIERLEPELSVQPLLRQFMCVPDTEKEILAYSALADRMVSRYPVWLLRNRADEDGARLTRQTLETFLLERSGE